MALEPLRCPALDGRLPLAWSATTQRGGFPIRRRQTQWSGHPATRRTVEWELLRCCSGRTPSARVGSLTGEVRHPSERSAGATTSQTPVRSAAVWSPRTTRCAPSVRHEWERAAPRRPLDSRRSTRVAARRSSASNSPSLAPSTKASHSFGVKTNTAPAGFFESRTAMAPSTKATSTQLSVHGPDLVLLRQTALLQVDLHAFDIHDHTDSSAILRTSAIESSGVRAATVNLSKMRGTDSDRRASLEKRRPWPS